MPATAMGAYPDDWAARADFTMPRGRCLGETDFFEERPTIEI